MKNDPPSGLPSPCPLCKTEAPQCFQHRVLQTATAAIHLCPFCDYLFAAKPDWLDQAYLRVINLLDTGCLGRTEELREQTALPIYLLAGPHGRWLDFGGGYGAYVRRMRDTGFDFRWHDPMAQNLFAGGFEDQTGRGYDGVTCFECLEHFLDPSAEVQKMLARGPRILFSTELRPGPVPSPQSWWYYGWEHGQHVGFHSARSLSFLAESCGLRLVSSGRSLHAFLPAEEIDSLAARLIRQRSLPLSAWAGVPLGSLFSLRVFFRSLVKGRLVSRDFLGSLERLLGSKTWPDHETMLKIVRSHFA